MLVNLCTETTIHQTSDIDLPMCILKVPFLTTRSQDRERCKSLVSVLSGARYQFLKCTTRYNNQARRPMIRLYQTIKSVWWSNLFNAVHTAKWIALYPYELKILKPDPLIVIVYQTMKFNASGIRHWIPCCIIKPCFISTDIVSTKIKSGSVNRCNELAPIFSS